MKKKSSNKKNRPSQQLDNVTSRRFEPSDIQRTIIRALETESLECSDMYKGALLVLLNSLNPERYAQSAHSLRELMEKLPRYWYNAVVATGGSGEVEKISSKLNNLEENFNKVKNGLKATGYKRITARLKYFFVELDRLFELRKEYIPNKYFMSNQFLEAKASIPKLVPLGEKEKKLNERSKTWKSYDKYFQEIAHHNKNDEKYEERVLDFENWMLTEVLKDIVPQTVYDLDAIDALIAEGEHRD